MIEHGTERNRKKEVTETFPGVQCETTDGHKFTMPGGGHTYTQTERYCRKCGWVTCKGILGALLCPGECGEDWL